VYKLAQSRRDLFFLAFNHPFELFGLAAGGNALITGSVRRSAHQTDACARTIARRRTSRRDLALVLPSRLWGQ